MKNKIKKAVNIYSEDILNFTINKIKKQKKEKKGDFNSFKDKLWTIEIEEFNEKEFLNIISDNIFSQLEKNELKSKELSIEQILFVICNEFLKIIKCTFNFNFIKGIELSTKIQRSVYYEL